MFGIANILEKKSDQKEFWCCYIAVFVAVNK